MGGRRPAPAPRRTLIRRATLDLTGLPPTPAEVAAFEADPAPDAFAKVVDRLLASPRYGERWGRHWLDVARYADTKGYVFQQERRYPYSYTYRDYVVRAFNDDKPYDRFVIEQIAADRLPAQGDNRALAALGFLTVGRRFLNVNEDIIDDRIDVVTRGLLGLTVVCARCHDHKYDPIPTDDYYSLSGVFASSDEPADLPVLDGAAPRPETVEFERAVAVRRKEQDDYIAKLAGEAEADVRGRMDAYLRAAFELGFNGKNPKFDERAKADGLPPGRLRYFMERWQARLAATARSHDPILSPWHAFAALAADTFPAKAAEVSKTLAEPADAKPKPNPIVAQAFAEKTPASMAEVVARYGALFGQTEARWREASKAGAKALPEPDWEALRLVLYAPDGPLAFATEKRPPWLSGDEHNHLQALAKQVDELQVMHPGAPARAMVMTDRPNPVEPHVLIRGNPGRPGKAVPRRFVKLLSASDRKPFQAGSGRLELAQAIVRPDNPLTPRVLVNRVWSWHFGQGLVDSPSDFGLRCEPPANPALLDYLAAAFVRDGWSIKSLHRRIMLSSVYQQSGENVAAYAERDPQNRLLWKFNRQRLDFEAMRDSLLAVSGRLDATMGGRAVSITEPPFSSRRTLYGLIDRQNLDGMFRSFDFASPDATSPRRFVTTVPQQALFLMNSPFVIEQSRDLAAFAQAAGSDSTSRIRALYFRLFGRAPSPAETALALEFVDRQGGQETPAPNWQYGYGTLDESAQRVTRFEPFAHWTGSLWQPGPTVPLPQVNYVQLSAEGGHTGPDASHAAIRRWTARGDGVVAIEGSLRHDNPQGDGVRGRIVSSRSGVLGTWVAHHGRVETRVDHVEVRKGETIDFVADCRADDGFDSFAWSPVVRALSPTPASWSAKDDFQGPGPRPLGPWEEYAQVLLLTNEFMFVD
ncbi:MAG: DUF1549 and DUF1553 domain-containing protein [Isosphaeraceae bacterium]|nr:DUF1549 and DUF1553 domain-containing protein [Isosphaeraceae bacterium]